MIKVTKTGRCRYEFPLLSPGGLQIGKDYCQLPIDHQGPHIHKHLGIAVNKGDVLREFDPATGKKYFTK